MSEQLNLDRLVEFTIPAGTPEDEPLNLDISFPPMTVTELEVAIPDGPCGLAGIRIMASGEQLWPFNQGTWVTGNKEVITRNIMGWPDSGRFSLQGYNTGDYDHTITVRLVVVPNGQSQTVTSQAPESLPVTSTGEVDTGEPVSTPPLEPVAEPEAQPAPEPVTEPEAPPEVRIEGQPVIGQVGPGEDREDRPAPNPTPMHPPWPEAPSEPGPIEEYAETQAELAAAERAAQQVGVNVKAIV